MRKYNFEYRCRKCGAVYIAASTSEEKYAIGIMNGAPMVRIHDCSELDRGIADFIGCTVKEENQ